MRKKETTTNACAGRCDYQMEDGTCLCILAPNSDKLFTSTEYSHLTYDECMELKDSLGIDYCCTNSNTCPNYKDYWGGAVKACGGIGNMPTPSQLVSLAGELYNDDTIVSVKPFTKTSNLTLDEDKAALFLSARGSGYSYFYIYTNELIPGSEEATTYNWNYYATYTGLWGAHRGCDYMLAVCVD